MSSSFFVDWLNVRQKVSQVDYPDFNGGRVISVTAPSGSNASETIEVEDRDTGEVITELTGFDSKWVDYELDKFADHRGSFETNLLIRLSGGVLEVRGNPSAYGRLDNLFGLSLDESISVYNRVLEGLNLPRLEVGEYFEIPYNNSNGEPCIDVHYTGAVITRCDLTMNLAVGVGNVRNFNKWIAQQKIYRSSMTDSDFDDFVKRDNKTAYLSTSKYHINAKVYDKGAAIEEVTIPGYSKKLTRAVREGRIDTKLRDFLYNEAEEYLNRLALWCAEQGVARIEYSFKSRWFQQSKIENLGHYNEETQGLLLELVEKEFAKIRERAIVHQVESFENLKPAEYTCLDRWKKGIDVRELYSKSSFYRMKKIILDATGYDIGSVPSVGESRVEYRPVYFKINKLSVADAPSWYRKAA